LNIDIKDGIASILAVGDECHERLAMIEKLIAEKKA
jgi:hypothetical protein